jgi:hypothetical protein
MLAASIPPGLISLLIKRWRLLPFPRRFIGRLEIGKKVLSKPPAF